MRALGVRIEQPGATHVLIHGVGLHGLRDAGRALDMGNAGTAMRLFTGLLSAQKFDSQPDRRRIAHEAADGAGGQAIARNGGRCAYLATVRRRSISAAGTACTESTIACRCERPGQIGNSSGGLVCRRSHHDHCAGRQPRSQRAHAQELRGARGHRRAAHHPASAAALAEPDNSPCPAIFLPPRSSSSPGFWRRRQEGLTDPERGNESDAHRTADDLAQHGRQYRHIECRATSGAEPVADLRVYASPLRGVQVPEESGVRWPSTSFRCCSSRRLARRARPG